MQFWGLVLPRENFGMLDALKCLKCILRYFEVITAA
jgi:hypothetical protein